MKSAEKTLRKLATVQNATLAGVLLLAAVFINNTIRAVESNYDLQIEVAQLQEEVEILELEKTNLELLKQYYETEEFAEYEARRRFGKYKDGETRIVFSSEPIPEQTEDSELREQETGIGKNLRDWWDFFF